ncbi:hypothetical protein [Spiroplasma eriocheiris]|uniref:Uncharacterized protein n=1 Tax=Spiroplasma eriocheiris TaxID=315358 RepID=A0A0H3XHJ6_9MOLU|nr:hypothetical protein [Spiroplasma eriocheiris]AHF57737.1 hypothetical protein SPE_0609 [Spiroplasma eriocheiris CCTCC M 207170]AKM54188.1 hypothetical protein SERIO_v1c06170 [Spiroplasma eriocheiris]
MKFNLTKIKKMESLQDFQDYLLKTYLPKNNNRIIKAELLNIIHDYFPLVSQDEANQFIETLQDNKVLFLRGYGFVGNGTLESVGKIKQVQASLTNTQIFTADEITSELQKTELKPRVKKSSPSKRTSIVKQPTTDFANLSFNERFRNFIHLLYPVKPEKNKPQITLSDIPDLFETEFEQDEDFIDPAKRNIITKAPNDNLPTTKLQSHKQEKLVFDFANITSSEEIWANMGISDYRKYFLAYHRISLFQYQGLRKFFIDYLLALPISDKLIDKYFSSIFANKKLYQEFYDNYLRNRIKYSYIVDYNLFYDVKLFKEKNNKYEPVIKLTAEKLIINLFLQFLTSTFNVDDNKLQIDPVVITNLKNLYWDFNQKMHLFEFKDYIFSTNPKWKEEYALNFINFFEKYKFSSNQEAINLITNRLESSKLQELLTANLSKINFKDSTINDKTLWYDVKMTCRLLDNELIYIKGNLLDNMQTIFEQAKQ